MGGSTYTGVALIGLILIILRFLGVIVYNLYLSPLKKFPGPWLWKISSIPFSLSELSGQKHQKLAHFHEKYGREVRIAPNHISYINPRAVRDIWDFRKGHEEFPKDTEIGNPDGPQGILTADRADHTRYRRQLAYGFSAQSLREQEPRINHYVDLLVDRISATVATRPTEPLNVVPWFNWTAYDVIGDLTWGESFGCLENTRDNPWISGIFAQIRASVVVKVFRRLSLSRLTGYFISKKTQQDGLANYIFVRDKTAERVKLGSGRGDFFDHVLKHGQPETTSVKQQGPGMSIYELEVNATNLLMGGGETTATLLSGVVFALLSNPDVLKKATQEVRGRFGTYEEITVSKTSECEYLLAVLNESMRIYPPIPIITARKVPAPGDTVDGEWLPEGTIVSFPNYAAYNSSRNFVTPLKFIPDRWLKDQADDFFPNERDVFEPFSTGPRNCIGRHLAYAEMRLILAKLLWSFDLAIPSAAAMEEAGHVGGLEAWLRWIQDQRTFVLWEKSALWVDFKLREA